MLSFQIGKVKWLNSGYIINASVKDGSDRFINEPIGFSWQLATLDNDQLSKLENIGNSEKQYLLFNALNKWTDRSRRGNSIINRKVIANNLFRNGFRLIRFGFNEYIENIGKYKFVISPEGNGIDCHRHYEAWLAGCIPIIENNPNIKEKYEGLPILFTTDYSEITPEYLEEVYDRKFKGKTFDYSKLFLENYDPITQDLIRDRSRFWINKLTSKT